MKTLKITLLFTFYFAFLFSDILIAQKEYKPIVKKSIFYGKSKPIRDMKIVLPGKHLEKQRVVRNFLSNKKEIKYKKKGSTITKPNLQRYQGSLKSKGPVLNFKGVDNVNGVYPADPNGDVSHEYYIQSVNSSFAVWDKNGNLVFGPVDYQSLWDGFPGPWTNLCWCDPVFKYDRLADRWVISTMAYNPNQLLFYTMIAVSETSDPLGEYNCYAYVFEEFNDYPKLSVWPNGYYLTQHIYTPTNVFLYSLVTAMDREAMLAGASEVTMIEFEITDQDTYRFFPLPADFNGTDISSDLPCYIAHINDPDSTNPWDLSLDIYTFDPDWEIPANSTFDNISQLEIGEFEPMDFIGPGAPQAGSPKNVITIPHLLMYPLTYRQFEDHESMVCCLTTWDGNIYYIKWFELRKDDNSWYMYQQGNYAPDSSHRYQPSISINANGDIAMGYTVSDEQTFPSTRMTGRRANDPLGVMTYQELDLFKGLNYINTASMMVDPVNDTTFWFTNMYPKSVVSSGNWGTRIFAINLTEEVNVPYACAGPDTTICGYEDFELQGEANNFSSLNWETDGDGWFTINNEIITTYIRGNNDLENGQVTLSLTVTGYEPGTLASDSMILFLNKLPSVTAGPDDTICVYQSYSCQGEVSFSNTYYWTSTGNGSFNDSTLLQAIYTPAFSDTTLEEIILTLYAEPLYPCTNGDDDELMLRIESCLGITEFTDGIKLNVYPNPSKGLVTVEADKLEHEKTIIRIINSEGRIIFSGTFPGQTGQLKKQFDFGMLPMGAYYLKLINENNTNTVQLIIQ
jgi:hypothetical protein